MTKDGWKGGRMRGWTEDEWTRDCAEETICEIVASLRRKLGRSERQNSPLVLGPVVVPPVQSLQVHVYIHTA